MWAYIKDNKIEQIYQRPKSLILGEVRYPSNMFTKYTDAEKAAIGIYPVEDSGTKGDDRFENTSQATYTWSASDKKVTTSYTITEKSLVDVEAKDGDGNNIEIQGPYCFVDLPFFTGFEITSNIAASGLLPVNWVYRVIDI